MSEAGAAEPTGDGVVFPRPQDIAARVLSDDTFRWSESRLPGVYLRADSTVPWEIIAPIVQACGREKIEVSMVTKPLEKNPYSE